MIWAAADPFLETGQYISGRWQLLYITGNLLKRKCGRAGSYSGKIISQEAWVHNSYFVKQHILSASHFLFSCSFPSCFLEPGDPLAGGTSTRYHKRRFTLPLKRSYEWYQWHCWHVASSYGDKDDQGYPSSDGGRKAVCFTLPTSWHNRSIRIPECEVCGRNTLFCRMWPRHSVTGLKV